MNLELNVVRFNNEDVIATSGECEKTVYELHYDGDLHQGIGGYNADYVTGDGASALGLNLYSCGTNHGADVAHLNGVTADIVDSTYVSGTHFTGTSGKVFHFENGKFVVCPTPEDHNN